MEKEREGNVVLALISDPIATKGPEPRSLSDQRRDSNYNFCYKW